MKERAVLLSDEGWTPQQIAKVLLISDQAVREHPKLHAVHASLVDSLKKNNALEVPKSGLVIVNNLTFNMQCKQ